MKKLLTLMGRISISLIFIASAVTKVLSWDSSVHNMTKALTAWIASTHFPDFMQGFTTEIFSYTTALMIIATLLEGVGGLFILLGFKVRLGAILLLLFMLPVTVVMHPFWLAIGQEKSIQLAMFMKNLAIVGGLLILAAKGGDAEA